jgi:(1->4)-alpha-D-glucan 1-alpha-D-glucosylmutase
MSAPRATMRLQFHSHFTFRDASDLVPYFASLGISHVYASPIMTSRPGSVHGYDVIDPTRINPELGGEQALRRFVNELRRHKLGLIVDIVPNHMAADRGNAWWMDVLANGRDSRYARYFDIDWTPPNEELRGKVLLPVLGRPYGEALEAGEITLHRAAEPSTFVVRYFDNFFPITAADNGALSGFVIDDFDPRSTAGRTRLHNLLERQHYRLAWWRSANDTINWRRFFDINELIAIRVEEDEVFEAVHAEVFRLYEEGLIDGVRVDHIDGLVQPGDYCTKLRERLRLLNKDRPPNSPNERAYIVVEKILARDEKLPGEWQTNGTTGYDFMDEVSALLHDQAGEPSLRELWQRVSGRAGDFATEEEAARRQILRRSFSAQRDAAVQSLFALAASDLGTRDIPRAALTRCLTEILAHFPVYRTYARIDDASQADCRFLLRAIERAKITGLAGDAWLWPILERWLSGRQIRPELGALQAVALARFQQLSAPLCAKAVEDTAFYRYGRLISRNDVGFDASRFACSSSEFHQKMQARASELPQSMLATATHDHKRGEDVRARLAVLSELADDWASAVQRWIALSAPDCETIAGWSAPSAGDRAILFQTIVGAWPMTLTPTDHAGLAAYGERIAAWQQKALREAKLCSDWMAPNEAYERGASDFVARLFSGSSEFLPEIADFARRIGPAGAVNGLAQVLVKLTAPGVADIYQGTEYWDLSLVDPDNRRPVDFAVRQNTLAPASAAEMAAHWVDGRVKQNLIARVLAMRNKMPGVVSEGAYLPLEIAGSLADHVVAFARVLHNSTAITVICRFAAHLLTDEGALTIPPCRWKDTHLIVPPQLEGTFREALTPERTFALQQTIGLGEILHRLPVALLTNWPG